MEQEKRAKEAEEKEKAEKEQKVKEGYGFDESKSQWQQDKNIISDMAKEAREKAAEAQSDSMAFAAKPDAEPAAQPGQPEQPNTVQTAAKVPLLEDDLRKKQL